MENVEYVNVAKTAELLDKTEHSVRQLLHRGKLGFKRTGFRVVVSLADIMVYHARKKNIPSWEENRVKNENKSFVSVQSASTALLVQPTFIIKLIQKGVLVGYVTMNGDILIEKESVNAYLRQPDNDSKSL